jgi:hypothetical protein
MSDSFWLDDPEVLYQGHRLLEFFPCEQMSSTEKLNALTRFFIYLGLLLFLFLGQLRFLRFSILVILLIIVIHFQLKSKLIEPFYDRNLKQEINANKNTPIQIPSEKPSCQTPQQHNPFMNNLVTDTLANPNRVPACYLGNQGVPYFDHNLYQSSADIWNKRNSQREYFTMPFTTVPNDRDSFMKWCNKTTMVCRDGD